MAAHLTPTSRFNWQFQKLLEKEVSIILELIFPKIKHCQCSGKNICFQDLSTLQNVFVSPDRNSHIFYNCGIFSSLLFCHRAVILPNLEMKAVLLTFYKCSLPCWD